MLLPEALGANRYLLVYQKSCPSYCFIPSGSIHSLMQEQYSLINKKNHNASTEYSSSLKQYIET